MHKLFHPGAAVHCQIHTHLRPVSKWNSTDLLMQLAMKSAGIPLVATVTFQNEWCFLTVYPCSYTNPQITLGTCGVIIFFFFFFFFLVIAVPALSKAHAQSVWCILCSTGPANRCRAAFEPGPPKVGHRGCDKQCQSVQTHLLPLWSYFGLIPSSTTLRQQTSVTM